MRLLKRIFCGLLIALVALAARPAPGLAESPRTEGTGGGLTVQVTVGYDGVMTYGKPMPLTVRLENNGADLEGRIAVNIYANRKQYDRCEAEITLAAGAVKEVRFPVRVGIRQDTYTVEVWRGDEKICAVDAAAGRTVNPNAMLAGVLAGQPQSLTYLDVDAANDPLMRNEYIKTVPLTAGNFPDTAEMMSAFGMLVIDGFDVRTLSDAQQKALKGWLENGHILLLGGGAGAAAGWPAFEEETGLTPGPVESLPDPTGAMLAYLDAAETPLGGEIFLARAAGGDCLIADGETPVLWRSGAGNGVIYTAAFSLADKALAQWPPMRSFFQRLLIREDYSLYRQGFSGEVNTGNYSAFAVRLPIENTVPLLPAALAAAAILLLGGGIAYFLLRHRDRRQFMWLALPMLAVAAAATVAGIAGQSRSSRPAALGVTVIRQDEEGVQSRDASLALGMAARGLHIVSLKEGTLSLEPDNYWYYDENAAAPAELRYTLFQGEKSAVGVNQTTAWDSQFFQVEGLPVLPGRVEARAWMEEDGLHGVLVNHTGAALGRGLFCCKYGYCAVPALADGESCDLFLRKSAFADEKNPVYDDGCMYESLAGTTFSAFTMTYEFYYQQSHQKNGEINWSAVSLDTSSSVDLMANALNDLSVDYSGKYGYNRNPARQFFYAAYTEDVKIPDVAVDGEGVDRTNQKTLFCAVVPFGQAAGSGLIYRMPGMDAAIRCRTDENGAPVYDEKSAGSDEYSYPLNDRPVFMFRIPEAAGAEINRLVFYSEYVPNQARAYLYDGEEWVEYTMEKDVENPGQYVDGEGRIYLQFRPVVEVENYYDVYAPTVLLEGREK